MEASIKVLRSLIIYHGACGKLNCQPKHSYLRWQSIVASVQITSQREAGLPVSSRSAGGHGFNVMLCSADVERFLAKTTKLICNPQRNRLGNVCERLDVNAWMVMIWSSSPRVHEQINAAPSTVGVQPWVLIWRLSVVPLLLYHILSDEWRGVWSSRLCFSLNMEYNQLYDMDIWISLWTAI